MKLWQVSIATVILVVMAFALGMATRGWLFLSERDALIEDHNQAIYGYVSLLVGARALNDQTNYLLYRIDTLEAVVRNIDPNLIPVNTLKYLRWQRWSDSLVLYGDTSQFPCLEPWAPGQGVHREIDLQQGTDNKQGNRIDDPYQNASENWTP